MYCEPGQSPKVKYFKEGKETIYYSPVSPIEVEVVPKEDPNIKDEIYLWNFSTGLNPRSQTVADLPFEAFGKLTDFRVDQLINTDVVAGRTLGNWAASFLDGKGNRVSGSAVGTFPGDTPKLVKMLKPIPNKPPTEICTLKVKNELGTVIFEDDAKCPIPFEVICSNCPKGQKECSKSSYPGYCCIPCSQISGKIYNLAAKIK
jgi:hypothetical protein